MELHNCPHCNTNGILIMSDGRCPNCKVLLVEAFKNDPVSTENNCQKLNNIQPRKTPTNSTIKEPLGKAKSPITYEEKKNIKECYRCGREVSHQLDNGKFWCAWCNNSFDASESGTYIGRKYLPEGYARPKVIDEPQVLKSLIKCLGSRESRISDEALNTLLFTLKCTKNTWLRKKLKECLKNKEIPESIKKKLMEKINPLGLLAKFFSKSKAKVDSEADNYSEEINNRILTASGGRPFKLKLKKCPICGEPGEVKGHIPFCRKCGTRWCPRCGTRIFGNVVYQCYRCGLKWCIHCQYVPNKMKFCIIGSGTLSFLCCGGYQRA